MTVISLHLKHVSVPYIQWNISYRVHRVSKRKSVEKIMLIISDELYPTTAVCLKKINFFIAVHSRIFFSYANECVCFCLFVAKISIRVKKGHFFSFLFFFFFFGGGGGGGGGEGCREGSFISICLLWIFLRIFFFCCCLFVCFVLNFVSCFI